ncbi:MAG: hypothetical protein J5892_03720 [Bacilli bacterium]|nr:hypothetical protein [Bacilli bacterium]
MISDEFDISDFKNKNYQDGLLKKVNNLYITNEEIATLEKYNVDVFQVKDFKELLAILRNILDNTIEEDEDIIDELNDLYELFSERDYYLNTNK